MQSVHQRSLVLRAIPFTDARSRNTGMLLHAHRVGRLWRHEHVQILGEPGQPVQAHRHSAEDRIANLLTLERGQEPFDDVSLRTAPATWT
jgi:hypothetical protein